MGACGCGDFNGGLTFPAPGSAIYVLSVYHGCEYCGTPAGVVIHRFTLAEAARWGVGDSAPLIITQDGTGIPVLDPAILIRLLIKEAAGEGDSNGLFREFIEDGARRRFTEAGWATYGEWEKQRRAYAARAKKTTGRAPGGEGGGR